MKSNILISSFAALCLMLTISEVPNHTTTEKSFAFSANPFSYFPVKNSSPVSEKKFTVITSAGTSANANLTQTDDFSYLKFDVSNYVEDYGKFQPETDEPSVYTQSTFDYLKFDVSAYVKNDVPNSAEPTALSEKDFDYLKFDVSKFAAANTSNQDESSELTAKDFDYLKFDANKYCSQSATLPADLNEFPSAE